MSTRLDYKEGLQLLNQRLLAQTKYGLHLSQFKPAQCQQLSAMINETFLPILKIHRKMSRTTVWGPKGLGGLELNTNVYNMQAQCALIYLQRTLRWNRTVANDILTTLNAVQLASGFGANLLEQTSPPIKYLGKGWILHLREMLQLYQSSVWIERAWKPQRQRRYDEPIMEVFARDELANIQGTSIEIERIQNDSEWRAIEAKGYRWPNTITPTNRHRAAFRKCIRLTFCPGADMRSQSKDYPLLQHLGSWYPVPRMIQYTAYRAKDKIYYRDELGLHECSAQGKGFYKIKEDVVESPPLKSHPIEPNLSDSTTFWTHKKRRMVRPFTPRKLRITTRDELPDGQIDQVDLVSDAAVHVEKGKGAITWHAVTAEKRRLSMDVPIEVERNSYSYRHELIGSAFGVLPVIATTKQGSDAIHSPAELMAPDMDVVMAIKQLLEDFPKVPVQFRHVQGHADRKKPKHKCSWIEQINIDCDDEAEECVERDYTPTPLHPLPGSRCMVKISGRWITARIDKAMQLLTGERAQKEYICQRLKITLAAVADIDTDVIVAARSTHAWPRLARTSKLMTHWLPVGHNWKKHGADNNKCPCCGEPDETFHHLLQCTNDRMRNTVREAIQHSGKVASQLLLPPQIVWLALRLLKQECAVEDLPVPTEPRLSRMWDAQREIGHDNFVIGWLSQAWREGMHHFGSRDPGGQASQLLTLIWDGLCEPVWACRNDIRANTPNPKDLLEMSNLREKLEWYRRFKNEVLPHQTISRDGT